MSIVGPRPALPTEVATYDDYQRQRLLVKPGVTCYWQTRRNRDSITFDEWVDLDLWKCPLLISWETEIDLSTGMGQIRIQIQSRMPMRLNSPQALRYGCARWLYEEGARSGLLGKVEPHTTSLMFAMGERVWFSKGSTANIKITTADDLRLFKGWVLADEPRLI